MRIIEISRVEIDIMQPDGMEETEVNSRIEKITARWQAAEPSADSTERGRCML